MSCDCMQHAAGVVVDKESGKTLDKVALGKFKKETDNPYSKRSYTDALGRFEYSSISGGLSGCPKLTLFFSKDGYHQQEVVYGKRKYVDTIYMIKDWYY